MNANEVIWGDLSARKPVEEVMPPLGKGRAGALALRRQALQVACKACKPGSGMTGRGKAPTGRWCAVAHEMHGIHRDRAFTPCGEGVQVAIFFVHFGTKEVT